MHNTAMQKNQKGFGLALAIIILVVILFIGAAGWYVWRSQNKSQVPLTTSIQSQNNQQIENEKYLEIKEWGIKIKLTYADSLTYSLKGTPGYNAVFRYVDEAQIEFKTPPAGDPNCKETGLYFSKVDSADIFTVKTRVGQFYYGSTASGGGCEEGALEMKLKTLEELKNPVIVEL